MVVAGILTSLGRAVALLAAAIGTTFIGVGVGVQLERIVLVGVCDIVAGQARHSNTANRVVRGVSFVGVTWLLADVGLDWNLAGLGWCGSCVG